MNLGVDQAQLSHSHSGFVPDDCWSDGVKASRSADSGCWLSPDLSWERRKCPHVASLQQTDTQREFGGSPVAFYDPALGVKQLHFHNILSTRSRSLRSVLSQEGDVKVLKGEVPRVSDVL